MLPAASYPAPKRRKRHRWVAATRKQIPNPYREYLDECQACVRACVNCILRENRDQPQVASDRLELLWQCAQVCRTSASLIATNEKGARAFATVCSSMCCECAQACEAVDDECFRHCAKACLSCAAASLVLADPG